MGMTKKFTSQSAPTTHQDRKSANPSQHPCQIYGREIDQEQNSCRGYAHTRTEEKGELQTILRHSCNPFAACVFCRKTPPAAQQLNPLLDDSPFPTHQYRGRTQCPNAGPNVPGWKHTQDWKGSHPVQSPCNINQHNASHTTQK